MRSVVVYGAIAATFLAIDLVWLGVVARDFYRTHLGGLLAEQVHWGAALAFYALYVLGIVVFVVQPAVGQGGGLWHALAYGALFGLVCYGTYDLTNLAVLKGFSPVLAVVDMLWGAALTASAAAVGVLVARY